MRYFARLAYNGTRFMGWQIQPDTLTVQGHIEQTLSMILRQTIEVTGCGRTDTGVHAEDYVLHFDYDQPLPDNFVQRLNRVIGPDVVFYTIQAVEWPEAHARFSASSRAYRYSIDLRKNPFRQETAWQFHQAPQLDIAAMNEVCKLLLEFKEFAPFCKTHAGNETMFCDVRQAQWSLENEQLVFRITANRFLRGMIRLIVGECVQVGLGKYGPEQTRRALETQTALKMPYSVPACGLFLTDIQYPFDI